MTTFLLNEANFWFSIALVAVFVLGLMECIGLAFKVSLLGVFDDTYGIDHEFDDHQVPSDSFTTLARWLSLDHLPIMVWLSIFLFFFGVLGFSCNWAFSYFPQIPFPDWASVPASVIISLLVTSFLGRKVALWLPAHRHISLVTHGLEGSVGHITMGTARQGTPAEARFVDHYQHPRYVLVEPLEAEEYFEQGEKVVLVKQTPKGWLVSRAKKS